jgi:cyclohexyl-isocyanide hydratase
VIIGIPIYDQVDLLDVAAPCEIFDWFKRLDTSLNIKVYLIAAKPGLIKTRAGTVLKPDKLFRQVPKLDVLWVPGGDPEALKRLMNDRTRTYLDFLITRSRRARWVTSVCEGALLLAKAGLLDGYKATTHWAFIPCLKKFPAIKVVKGYPRFVVDRNRVTGGGVSSGLDEALKLVELLSSRKVAQQVQQNIQYYPRPPVASSIPATSDCPLDS